MSNYDDGRDSALDTPLSRESGGEPGAHGGAPHAHYGPPQSAPGYGGYQQMPPSGYQQQWVMRPKTGLSDRDKAVLPDERVRRGGAGDRRDRDHRGRLGRVRGLARLDPDHSRRGRLHG